jgi:hypothetical protein
MASSINASTSGAGGVITTADNTGILNLQTASTTAVTVDASQNVGIGTTSPSYKLDVATIAVATSQTGGVRFGANDQYSLRLNQYTTVGGGPYAQIMAPKDSNGWLAFTSGASDTERMRIDGSGNVGIGNNVSSLNYLLDITTNTASLVTSRFVRMPSDANFAIGFRNGVVGTTSGTEIGRMNWSYAGTDIAYISGTRGSGADANRINVVCNMTGGVFLGAGSTSWGSLSDERQKTNLEPIVDASNKLNTLRTVTGRYITDEETVSRAFLIAQDVQKVLPEAVDAQEDEDGTLGLRYTDLIPLLIAGFKEQQTIINDLKARVTALEAK